MRILVDLNILLDIFQKREPHFSSSRECLIRLQNEEEKPLVSSHCIPTLFYILRKTSSKESARECVSWVLDTFEIAKCSKDILRKACDGSYEDFEDGIIIEEAVEENCDRILTRDSLGFKKSRVQAITPADFLTKG